jgi:hypothetical protein
MKTIACILILLTLRLPAAAQSAQPCSTPEASAFDFWIGEWDIQQRILNEDGSWHEFEATTTVTPALDGCALLEQWAGTVQFFWEGMQSPEPMKGLSVRAYDPVTGLWRIHWMDTRTLRFDAPYEGSFDDGQGIFYLERETPQGPQRNRITFSDISPNFVNWELAVSSDGGSTWTALWVMEMRRTDR